MATLTPRQPYDYPEAVRLEVLCGECGAGQFPEPCYYDREDRHITRDPWSDEALDRVIGQMYPPPSQVRCYDGTPCVTGACTEPCKHI